MSFGNLFFDTLKNNIYKIVFVIFTLPIIFININSKHDWGDDYAQYLDQAKHIVNEEKSIEPKILDSKNYAPLERGEGFSLLLTPNFYFFSNQIAPQIYLVSISLFLFGLVLLSLLKKIFTQKKEQLSPYLIVILLLYNYHVLLLKMEILPIFPFMLTLYFCFWIISKKNQFLQIYVLPLIIGFLISLWNIGTVFYIAYLLCLIFSIIKNRFDKKTKQLIFSIFLPFATYFIIKYAVSGGHSIQNFTWYSTYFVSEKILQTIQNNLGFYLNVLKLFFEQEIWAWANVLIKDFALIMFLLGLINKLKRKFNLMDLFFLIYISVILIYPYQDASIRFLLPIIPIVFIYIIEGIHSIILNINFLREKLSVTFLIIVILSNSINVRNIIEKGDSKIYGANGIESQESFSAIKHFVSEKDVICFAKPLALHFYTERKTISTEKYDNITKLKCRMKEFNAKYLLICTDKNQKAVFFENLPSDIHLSSDFTNIWSNQAFSLYILN